MLGLALAIAFAVPGQDITPAKMEKGTVPFKLLDDQSKVPERYRLQEHTFDYEMELKHDLPHSAVEIFHLQFPSPVESPVKENNTVHAEYYRPKGKGPFPGVIVLDITAGDQSVSRSIATHLASNNVAALFVQMAYYGPRRPPGSDLRLLSHDSRQPFANIRQTV